MDNCDINDEYAPVRDEVIQNFIDYQWNKNMSGVYVTSFQYILYGMMLAYSVYNQSIGYLCTLGLLAFYLMVCEFYFLGRTIEKYMREDAQYKNNSTGNKAERENIVILVAKGTRAHFSDLVNVFDVVGMFSYMIFLLSTIIKKGEVSYADHAVHLVALIAGTLNAIVIFFSFFPQTRYLVYMIDKVVVDFVPFFCVFFATMF